MRKDCGGSFQEPAAAVFRPAHCGIYAIQDSASFVFDIQELRNIAALFTRILSKVALAHHFRPSARGRKKLVAIAGGDNARKHPTGEMQRVHSIRTGFAQTLLKLMFPELGRSVWVIGEPAPELIEVPVTFELVIVIPVLRI